MARHSRAPSAIAIVPTSLVRARRPSERRRHDLDVVVGEAQRGTPSAVPKTPSAHHVAPGGSGTGSQTAKKMISPPIVGVPAFARCPCGALLADVLAELAQAQELDELRAEEDADQQRRRPPIRTRPIQLLPLCLSACGAAPVELAPPAGAVELGTPRRAPP